RADAAILRACKGPRFVAHNPPWPRRASVSRYAGRPLKLHLVTNRHRLSPGVTDATLLRRCLLRQVECAIDAAIDVVQIRERDLEGRALAALVAEAVAMTRGTRTRVVVNDRLDVAVASGADGVHLRADSIPIAAARAMAPSSLVIGLSVHSEAEAVAAALQVDYLIAGTVWPTSSKSGDH